ncbi:hypothetical protein COCSUDRAFT_59833 [Coccomyxa subellipsoidea C-169]|uniref:Integral membrane bound transporter domain-containing protein n=1 Tax=Coccomyxa subellipsoidea (strain C-169) TaxID=574566 RepID=I0YKJ0_COCSC|nr:hypothetical protein COCSUDRAFT_59833 [Coccomyxa subellipsoidea C-169]EIE18909.1 hypothetical protein COCSUDRAFT_59833 [Coccomyxa subellipsoidea C-169]|eukprot:XP_005643453.1 hypothetical protein COCSUDRAFT_59833 [Coccomyxa subellipsoidea C-169]
MAAPAAKAWPDLAPASGLATVFKMPLIKPAAGPGASFQLAVGQFGVSLFPLVPRMRFSQDCLAATLYLVSLAVATHHRTVFLCIFGVIGMIPFATVRAGSNPAISNPNGIAGMLVYGVVVLNSQFVDPLRSVWREVVANVILVAVIAGLATALSGALVLPTLAGDELRGSIAATLRGLGQSISGYAGFIFAPDQHEIAMQRQATKRTLGKFVDMHGGEEPTEEAFFEELQHATKPRLQRQLPKPGGPGGVLAGSLQPLLGNARMRLRAASCEPAFLQRSPMVTSDWAALIAAVENLTIRVAALESLLEGRSQYLRSAFFQKYFGVDLLPSFRLIHSLIAVACAKLGKAVMCHRRKQEVRLKVMFGDQWGVVRKVLTADIATALDSYWARVREEEKEGIFITPAAEIRALLFVTLLTAGIVDSMEEVEKAALSSRGAFVKAMKDRFFQFWLKFWLTCAVVLVLILVHSDLYTEVRKYYPFYGFLSVPIVMSERVEMTISKGVLRIGGTVVGGTLGFLVMLRSGLATNPYLLMLIVVTVTFLLGFGGRTQYLYAIMLTLISANALVLSQATKFSCTFCDEAGSAHYYAARVLSISIGCLAAMLASNIILPWYGSQTALDLLAAAYKNSFELMDEYCQHFYLLNRSEAGLEPDKEVAPFPTTALQQRIALPLSKVQMALAKESVLWKTGWYTFPTAVKRTLVELMDLQNRLAALDIVVRQARLPPSISGRYTGSAFRNFMGPAKVDYDRMMASLGAMVKSACSLLRGDGQGSYAQLKEDIKALEANRGKLRAVYLAQREQLHNNIKAAVHREDIVTHDDAARFLSWMWTFMKSVDKAEAVAKVVLLDECRKRDDVWAWIK